MSCVSRFSTSGSATATSMRVAVAVRRQRAAGGARPPRGAARRPRDRSRRGRGRRPSSPSCSASTSVSARSLEQAELDEDVAEPLARRGLLRERVASWSSETRPRPTSSSPSGRPLGTGRSRLRRRVRAGVDLGARCRHGRVRRVRLGCGLGAAPDRRWRRGDAAERATGGRRLHRPAARRRGGAGSGAAAPARTAVARARRRRAPAARGRAAASTASVHACVLGRHACRRSSSSPLGPRRRVDLARRSFGAAIGRRGVIARIARGPARLVLGTDGARASSPAAGGASGSAASR